ncbi:helix-turn-helix domain-containing protein [Kitasatospora sp. NPDC096140]|uniref:helix-turn-helix domain-containing protein n=1 Tax=Kitasatospora sp. NPDC096140 TaxID=3155425 RepID=UPI0033348AD6
MSVTDGQREVLQSWVRRRSTAQALALRSRIVLECAEGHSIMDVPRRLAVAPDTVRTWRRRFIDRGLDGLSDDPRPGVPRKITDADVERVIVKDLTHRAADSAATKACSGVRVAFAPAWPSIIGSGASWRVWCRRHGRSG